MPTEKPSRTRRLAPWFTGAAAVAALIVAGALLSQRRGQALAAPAPPTISVRSVTAQRGDVPLVLSEPGSVASLGSVDVRAQTTATIAKVHVREGQFVHAGDLLFTLDARAAEAGLLAMQAQLARDTATLADSQRQLQRNRDLLAQNFVSQAVVDSSLATVTAQNAARQADQAQIAAARVTLSYTRITAPVDGRLGAINVYPGSLVQPTSTTALVTVTRLDPIDVGFALPQRNLGDALAALRSGTDVVQLALPDNHGTRRGHVSFVDSGVDAATGTVKIKARFDNADHALWPGAFVDVKFAARTLANAVTVPQAALIDGDGGASLYTIDADGKARQQPVQRLASVGDAAVVQGVQAGQRVIVDGKQDVSPGVRVAERATATASSPASAP